jgi:hypothetical protein
MVANPTTDNKEAMPPAMHSGGDDIGQPWSSTASANHLDLNLEARCRKLVSAGKLPFSSSSPHTLLVLVRPDPMLSHHAASPCVGPYSSLRCHQAAGPSASLRPSGARSKNR